MKLLKRVAIIGPESTGKSWLTNELANYYNTNKVDEYAREYFRERKYEYSLADLIDIAIGQVKNEENIATISKDIIFCDTEMLVLKIWASEVFGSVPDLIEKQTIEKQYDLYLLCYPDLVWEQDPLRTNPHNREHIYNLFVKELEKNNCNFRVIKEKGVHRLNNAVKFVDELLKNGKNHNE